MAPDPTDRQLFHLWRLIRWLYVILAVIVVVGVAFIVMLVRINDNVHDLEDTQDEIVVLVDKVGENNAILCEHFPTARAC